jgi:5'-3' exoribonuclease 2
MAIDGVAPRAKMNQQRARRFRAALESKEKREKINERVRILRESGKDIELPSKSGFDSNCITPGTEFMHRLAESLRLYIADRISSDPAWKNIMVRPYGYVQALNIYLYHRVCMCVWLYKLTVQVIFSDANVPGEGEHKIMDYIRAQRAQTDYKPSMVCLS